MIIYFADKQINIVSVASSNTKQGLILANDDKVEDVDTGAVTFEFDLYFTEKNREKAMNSAVAGNYILKKNKDRYEFYTIIDSEYDTQTMCINVYAEDEGLDLLNEVTDDTFLQNTIAHPIAYYVNTLLYDTGFEIGLDELGSTRSRTLQWEAGNTATAQLDTVANAFEAEISFSFEIDGLMVKKKIVNIHKKRGNTDVATLRLDKQINNIKVKKSIANLATCYRVTGGIPEGAENPVTLVGYKYDDGDFYVSESGRLMSRNALSKWSRYQWEQGLSNDVGHIVKNFTSSLTTQQDLFNSALSSLKKVCDTQVEYEVDIAILPDNVRIGDTINIVDERHRLYINARVLKLETKEIEGTSTATLGNYKLRDYDVSQKIQDLSDEFVKLASKRQLYTWTVYADDDKGLNISVKPENHTYIGVSYNHMTKQDDAESIKHPEIYEYIKIKGEDADKSYTWIKYADNADGTGISSNPIGKVYIGFAFNKKVSMEDTDESNDPSNYKWSLIKGKDAVTYYTWIKFATDENGSNMSDSPIGRDYIGIGINKESSIPSTNTSDYVWTRLTGKNGDDGVGVSSITEEYYVSTSHTSLQGGEWKNSIPDIPAGSYLWSRMVITYTDDKTVTGVAKCLSGNDGVSLKSIKIQYYLSDSLEEPLNGEWTYIQPEFDRTKYLWKRQEITFTNDVIDYTEPEIEIAWSSAIDITVGGTNLLRNSKKLQGNEYYQVVNGEEDRISVTNPYGDTEDDILRIDFSSNNTLLRCLKPFPILDFYSFSIWVKSESNDCVLKIKINDATYTYDVKTSWTRVQIHFTLYELENANIDISCEGGVLYFYEAKLEKGDYCTDWSPSSKDLNAIVEFANEYYLSISNEELVNGSWDETYPQWSSGKFIWKRVKKKMSDGSIEYNEPVLVDVIKKEIEESMKNVQATLMNKITDVDGVRSSNIAEVKQLINDNYNAVQAQMSTVTQDMKSFTITTERITDFTEKLNGLSTKEDIKQWARFEDGVLELGESNSTCKVRLSTKELGFYDSNTKVAWVSNNQLHINEAVIMNRIILGEFVFEYVEGLGLLIY